MPSPVGGSVAWRAVAVGLIAAAPLLPIGLLALGMTAVARGLAALRGAGGRFRAVSGTARGGISGCQVDGEDQAAKGSQKQNPFHDAKPFLSGQAPKRDSGALKLQVPHSGCAVSAT